MTSHYTTRPGEEPPPQRYQGYGEEPRARPPQWPPRPQQQSRRQPPGNLLGTAIVALVLGVVIGGTGVYFLGPQRSSPEAEAVTAIGDQVNDAVNDAVTGGVAGTPEPKTEEGVRAGVQEYSDRYAAGDYGGTWDLWVAAAKREFSRDDYVALKELCPDGAAGIRFSIDAVDYTPGADVATVRVTRLIATWSYEFHYQDGGWKAMPEAESLAEYRQYSTGEAVAQARQADGRCGES